MSLLHRERHRSDRVGWLRATVLGANDGLISTASLVVGVAATGASQGTVGVTGIAGLVAGAMSMAAGEYVSVKTQADTEQADLARELQELETRADLEVAELASIYVSRGLDHVLAQQVAVQLTTHDALGAHARDELGITETLRARPVQASLASALSFAVGGLVALAPVLLVPTTYSTRVTFSTALFALLMLGGVAAYAGGASVFKGAARVAFWGVLAMGVTHLVGQMFSTLDAF